MNDLAVPTASPPSSGALTPTPAAPSKRAKPESLSIEPSRAAAETLAAILGVPLNADTAAEMSTANNALLDLRPAGLVNTLARNLVVLQALSMRLMKDAMEAKNPQAQASLLRTALQAQRETREVIALMRDLQREANEPQPVDG